MTTIPCIIEHNGNGMRLIAENQNRLSYVMNRSKIGGGAPQYLTKIEPEKHYITGLLHDKERGLFFGYDLSGIRYEVMLSKADGNKAIITIFDKAE
jgi:hypothetical protein